MNGAIKLDFDNIGYQKDAKPVLRNGSIELNAGEFALFLGKNGIGKTTLLFSLCGAIQCLSRFRTANFVGQLTVNDQTITPENKRSCNSYWSNSAIIFQYPDHNFITTSVIDEFLLSARTSNLESRHAFNKISALTKEYNIRHLLHAKIDELSDGTKQLVSLVSSFIRSPNYLFFDEPTALLDSTNKQIFIETLATYRKDNPGCIAAITTHEPEVFEQLSPSRIFVIDDNSTVKYDTIGEAKSAFYTGNSLQNSISNPAIGNKILGGDLLGSYYSQPESPVFSGLNISIREGELVTVTGRNGSGKTTLFKTLSTLHRKYHGRLTFRGNDYRTKAPKPPLDIAYIPQIPSLQFSEDTVEKEIRSVHDAFGKPFNLVQKIVTKALHPFNIQLSDDPLSLSYGQQKLVSLLSFLIYPGVLLIDEPVICLDWEQRQAVYEVIHHYVENGSTLVVATHSPGLFSGISTQEISL